MTTPAEHPLWPWLRDRGMTAKTAADEWRISYCYLRQILGGFRLPGAQTAKKIHKKTGIPLEQLLLAMP